MRNINVKGGRCFYSLSTQIYTITLPQLVKEGRICFKQDFIDNKI